MKNFALFVCMFIALSNAALAQKGTIRLSIIDDDTGEPLIGATALVVGTTIGSVADMDGKASIANLDPGHYNVQVSFVSYQSQTVQNVEVGATPVVLTIRMKPESVGLDEVVVEARALRNTENALLTIQKKSQVLLDAISSEQFSKNGDSDAAAAVRRVTGVSVEGGKYIYVRGLGDRYSKTTLNNAGLPSLDPNKNAVQLDLFPSNLIDNIIVYKAFSPELPGDFTGGLVNVVTKDFPDRFTFQASGSTGYNDQTTFNDRFLTSPKSATDFLGFDDGYRAMPTALKGYNSQNFPAPYINNPELDKLTKSFKDEKLDNRLAAPFVNHAFSVSLGNQHKLFRESAFGYVTALSYSRDFEFYDKGRTGRYSAGAGAEQLITESSLSDARGQETVLLSGLLNTSFKINNQNKIKINTLINQSGVNTSRNQEGLRARPQIDENKRFESRSMSYAERSMKNIQLGGEHTVRRLSNLYIHWLSSYTLSDQDEPDLKFFANNINIQPDGSIRYGFDAATSRRPSRFFRNLEETNLDNQLNFILPMKIGDDTSGKLKFGVAHTTKERTFREDRLEYFLANDIRFEGDIEAFLSKENLGVREDGRLGHYLSNVTERRNNYDADQQVAAAYLAAELPISRRLKMNGGLRVETTDINLLSLDGTKGEISEVDFLPALGATFEIQPEMNLRANYSKTIARPTFREIAPLATFDFIGDFIQLGNPDLERTVIDNFDLRWEMYPNPTEYVSVSAFYKNFTNPIENTIVPQSGSTDGEYRYNNVDQAILYGVELEVRKSLNFIAPSLENFRVGANVTLMQSEVDIHEAELSALRTFIPDAKPVRDMYNQSPYLINAQLSYNDPVRQWDAHLTYNIFGDRLSFVSTTLPYVYERSRPELNFSIAKGIGERVNLRLRANNLLNSGFEQTMDYKGEEYTFQSYNWGRSYSLGVSYSIQ